MHWTRVYYTDNTAQVHNLELSMDKMREIVGGDMQAVEALTKDYVLVVCDQGLKKGLSINHIASIEAGKFIYGNAILTHKKNFKNKK
jgi:hypothetical protein